MTFPGHFGELTAADTCIHPGVTPCCVRASYFLAMPLLYPVLADREFGLSLAGQSRLFQLSNKLPHAGFRRAGQWRKRAPDLVGKTAAPAASIESECRIAATAAQRSHFRRQAEG